MSSFPTSSTHLALPEGYQAIREHRSPVGWRICRARHATHGEVLVTSLDVSDEMEETKLRMQKLLDSLRESSQPELMQPVDIQQTQDRLFVMRAIPPGHTLLDELGSKGSFPRPVAARLLVMIYAAYEALWLVVGRRVVATSLDQFWLSGTTSGTQGGSIFLDASQLVLEASSKHGPPAGRPVSHFARLALLLLGHDGGSLTGTGSAGFNPIPELNMAANSLLRRALESDHSGEVSLPWLLAHLTATLAGHTAMAQEIQPRLSVPTGQGERAKVPVTRLRLVPEDSGQPILALIAEEKLWLGRSSTHSDFVAQFRPRSAINDARTRTISRAQATLYLQDSQVMLRDVSKVNPSVAGGRRLNDPETIDLPLCLLLASEYLVELRSLTAAYAPPGPKVDGWPTSTTKPVRRGSIVLRPLDSTVMPFETAWIFTDVTLVHDSSGLVLFEAAYAPAASARIHHHAGGFWLEVAGTSVTVMLNGQSLAHNEVVPIQAADHLQIGNRAFTVQGYALEVLEGSSFPA